MSNQRLLNAKYNALGALGYTGLLKTRELQYWQDIADGTITFPNVDFTGDADIGGTLSVDVIAESTTDAGVTIDSTLLKNGKVIVANGAGTTPTVTFSGSTELGFYNKSNTQIGVTSGGAEVMTLGSTLSVNTIGEFTADSGVTVDSVLLKDGGAVGTGVLAFGAGSAAAPTFAPGNTNLGMYRSAVNTLGWSVGGVQTMTLVSGATLTQLALLGAASSESQLAIDNTGSGDSTVRFRINGSTVGTLGVDRSDSNKLKLAPSIIGTNDYVVFNPSSLSATFGGDIIAQGSLNLSSPTELTISSGVITVTKSYHTVDTEADAATDDLETINGGSDGDTLVLRANNGGRTIVVKDNVGNLALSGDFSLDNIQDTITLINIGGNVWAELSRSDNGA